jgi:dephospho-CoA kinase
MQIIGILGGIASGKSLVARHFAELGAGWLDADRVAHEVLQSSEVKTAARARWGSDIFATDGQIDRKRMASIVFGDAPNAAEERKYLEKITHPEVRRRLKQQVESLAASGVPAAILDAPLLLEAGWSDECEKLVFVDCPRTIRLERALARGWNEQDFSVREDVQESLDRKRKDADAIIDNSGLPERTRAQVEQFWASLFC